MEKKLQVLILFVLISSSLQQNQDKLKYLNPVRQILEVQDNCTKWEEVCNLISRLINNPEIAEQNRMDVAIHDISSSSHPYKYNELYPQLLKAKNARISVRIFDYITILKDQVDYAILLISEGSLDYKSLIKNTFSRVYGDKSIKIIVILSGYVNVKNLQVVWTELVHEYYFNVYLISHSTSGKYNLYRTNHKTVPSRKPEYFTEKVQDKAFILFKNRLSDDDRSQFNMNVIFYNNFPLTYLKNNQILGAEGNLIREFCKKFTMTYKVVTDPATAMSPSKIYSLLKNPTDICLFTNFIMLRKNLDGAWLHEMDGLCLLVPRNIPISSYENFTLPIDNVSMILAFVSTVLLIVSWKVISMLIGIRRSIWSILLNVYQMVLNLGASGLEELSSHENIMIYCFIFGSFILMSVYETVILSLMLTDSTMRSALSLKELNESNTKFHSFYEGNVSSLGNLPTIRDELIINRINIQSMFQLEVPMNFDENLVYLVTCKYGNSFLKSSNNFREHRRAYDMLTLTQTYQRITTRSDFMYIDELKDMIERFEESGIYKLWMKEMVEKYQQGFHATNSINSGRELIEFGDMGLPLAVLLFGCLLSLILFFTEIINHRYKILICNRVNVLDFGIKRLRPPKINLCKWKKKYLLKKKLEHEDLGKLSILLKVFETSKHETIKCRESIEGGYFLMKKFKRHEKKFRFVRCNQVHPQNENFT